MSRSPRAVQTPGEAPADSQPTEVTQAAAPAPAEPSGLPDAADIDPAKLKRAVLTKQGWVCPTTSPAPPARQ